MKLNSFRILVLEMERSVKFYSDLFRKTPNFQSAEMAEFCVGDTKLRLQLAAKGSPVIVQGNSCVAGLETVDINIEHRRMKKLSRVVSELKKLGPNTLFEFEDPDGNRFEYYMPTESMKPVEKKEKSKLHSAAGQAVDDWFEDYVTKIYGVKGGETHLKKKEGKPQKLASSNELAERLSARFHEIDLVPKDGLVSYLEIERAITNPLLHWDETDLAMLKLLRRYYHTLIELSDDEQDAMDQGISVHDVQALANGLDERVESFRAKLSKEQSEQ